MARLQILELPEGTGDDRPPFILVIDQAPRDETSSAFRRDLEDNQIAAGIGARHVLVFEDTIDIPANDVPLDENGHPLFLKVHIEGEWEKFRAQAEEEIRSIQRRTAASLGRAAITDHDHRTALTDALGMDRTRDWDDIRNAAAGLRKQRDLQSEAIERVRQIHFKELQDDRHEDTGLCARDADDWPCSTIRAIDPNWADAQSSQPDA